MSTETPTYDIDYFIEKFSAIPDDKWGKYNLRNNAGQRCALGHCGVKSLDEDPDEEVIRLGKILKPFYKNSLKFNDPFDIVFFINDAISGTLIKDEYASLITGEPKENILNILNKAKKLQNAPD